MVNALPWLCGLSFWPSLWGDWAGSEVNWGRAGKDARGPIRLADPKASQTEMSPGPKMPHGPKCLEDPKASRTRAASRAKVPRGVRRRLGQAVAALGEMDVGG